MVTVSLNEDRFSYDIHSLVQAFFPGQEVKVFVKGSRDYVSSSGLPSLYVRFDADGIAISLFVPGQNRESGKDLMQEYAPFSSQADKGVIKNALKQALYRVLSRYTGRSLPWGSLTGIRPVKIAMGLLNEGRSGEEAETYLRETYSCSDSKSALAVQIAERERKLLSGLHLCREPGYSLYLGIPFCPTTCLYCSFPSFSISAWRERVGEYLAALEREIDFAGEAFRGRPLDTVYIGGGTPTSLEPAELDRLLSRLERTLDFSSLLEFTVEAGRADSITPEKLAVLHRHGVSRISVNPQTMQEKTLRLIGRRHSVEQVIEAFEMARQAGFSNINMDLILGLPEEQEAEVAATMEAVKALDPDNLTIHSLALKRGSRLWEETLQRREFSIQNSEAIMEIAANGAASMGMEPYYLYRQKNMAGNFENVGYAKPGKAGIYNVLIMEEVQDIVALGAGSISKRVYPDGRIERCENVKEVGQYLDRIDEMIERKRRLFAGQ